MRGATSFGTFIVPCLCGFQSTLPMRGATVKGRLSCLRPAISIHAPHAGSDMLGKCQRESLRISIHAPHAGSDSRVSNRLIFVEFQSTLPMRGATGVATMLAVIEFISIHAPHAGSDAISLVIRVSSSEISIHAPHAGSD